MTRCGRGLGCLALGALLCAACDQPISHVFIAGQYDPKLDCVSPGIAIDVLNGPPPTGDASCAATCIVPPFADAAYATGMCAPFPPGDGTGPDASPLCRAAVAALNRHDRCIDSGTTGPSGDSGSDAAHPHDSGAKDTSATQ